jgi:hypothetical protein
MKDAHKVPKLSVRLSNIEDYEWVMAYVEKNGITVNGFLKQAIANFKQENLHQKV